MSDSQRNKRIAIYAFAAGLVLAILAMGAFSLWSGRPPVTKYYFLSIYEGRAGNLLLKREVMLGDPVVLHYIHSADGTPVTTLFAVHEEGLQLVEESYLWYGSGLESGAQYDFTFSGGTVSVSGYDRIFETLPIRIARTVPQEIFILHETITLNQLAAGGTLLTIMIERE